MEIASHLRFILQQLPDSQYPLFRYLWIFVHNGSMASAAGEAEATSEKPKNERAEAVRHSDWPDPVGLGTCLVDDVTRLNTQHVDRVFCVRDKNDIKHVRILGLDWHPNLCGAR